MKRKRGEMTNPKANGGRRKEQKEKESTKNEKE